MLAASFVIAVIAAGPPWRAVGSGVEHMTMVDDGIHAEFVRFDLARYRPEVVVLGANGARTAVAARTEASAAAAVNGGFFDTDWRPLGLRIAAGKTIVKLRPRVDWGVLVLRRDRAAIVHSKEFQPDPAIEAAIQVGPRLVVAGEALRLKPQSARRTAVALDRAGRFLTLVVTRDSTEAQRLAEMLARLGFDSALMLDGGPSSQLSAAVGPWELEMRGGYAVPDLLVIRRR